MNNSDYASQFMASLHSQPAQPVKQERKFPKAILIVVIAVVVIVVIVVLLALILRGANDAELAKEFEEDDMYDDYSYQAATGEVDNLNQVYAAAAQKNPHAGYKTELEATKYVEATPAEVCNVLNLPCGDINNIENLEEFTEVGALNTNALEYYLDNGHMVVFSAYGEYPYSTTDGGVVAIYAADYSFGHSFRGFMLENNDTVSSILEFRRSELINGIIGLPRCFISKETL